MNELSSELSGVSTSTAGEGALDGWEAGLAGPRPAGGQLATKKLISRKHAPSGSCPTTVTPFFNCWDLG